MVREEDAALKRRQISETEIRTSSGTRPKFEAYPPTETKIPLGATEVFDLSVPPAQSILFDPLHAGCMLVRLEGDAAGQVILLQKSELLVGRTHSADIQLTDTSTSREHARIRCTPDGWSLQDLCSKNGTRVNGQAVEWRELKPGDLVEFGRQARFRFSLLPKLRESESSSLFDSLTGVYSARYFDARLHAEVAFARRHRRDCSLILLEPRRFEAFSEDHGTIVAEHALQKIAATCLIGIRVEDVLARQSRARFAVLMRDTPKGGAEVLKKRLLERIRAVAEESGSSSLPIDAVAGCATLFECPWPLAGGLLELAEQRLAQSERQSGL